MALSLETGHFLYKGAWKKDIYCRYKIIDVGSIIKNSYDFIFSFMSPLYCYILIGNSIYMITHNVDDYKKLICLAGLWYHMIAKSYYEEER